MVRYQDMDIYETYMQPDIKLVTVLEDRVARFQCKAESSAWVS